MEKEESLADTVKTVFYAVVIAILIRTFLFEPFKIPSGSMYPTLYVGDYLFVSKYTYGYSKHSLPFSLPLFNGRIWEDMPQRGDVVLLRGRFGVPLRVTGGTNAEITAGLEILDQITGMAEVPGVGGRGIGGDVSAQSQNVFNSRLPECL